MSIKAMVIALMLAGCAGAPAQTPGDVVADGPASEASATSGSTATRAPTHPGQPATQPGNASPPAETPADNWTPAPKPWRLDRDGWAPVGEALIYPGVQVMSYHGGCTVNFVFTNLQGTRAFVGTAAHCASPPGGFTCAELTAPESDEQRLAFFGPDLAWKDPSYAAGSYVYNSNLAMYGAETDENACYENDFAVIEVDPRITNPSLEVWGGPVAPSTDHVGAGAKLYTVGGTIYRNTPSTVPVPVLELTRAREGYTTPTVGGVDPAWGVFAQFAGQCLGGDSGSPVLDGQGHPVGIVEGSVQVVGANCRITYLNRVLDYANSHRGCSWCLPNDVTLVLAAGTETFTPGVLPD